MHLTGSLIVCLRDNPSFTSLLLLNVRLMEIERKKRRVEVYCFFLCLMWATELVMAKCSHRSLYHATQDDSILGISL